MKDNDNIYLQSLISDESDNQDFISLLSPEEEDEMNKEVHPDILPILPLRNTVLFPGVVIPITVGRERSIKLIKEANKGNKIIGVVAQLDPNIEDPVFAELYQVGTVAKIIRMMRMPDGNTTAIIQGKRRFKMDECVSTEPHISAKVTYIPEGVPEQSEAFQALVSSIKDSALQIIDISPQIPSEAGIAIRNIDSPNFLLNFISSNMNADLATKQRILETEGLQQRCEVVLQNLNREIQVLTLKNEIQSKVRGDMDKQQREFFLQQQIRALQEELGGDSPEKEIENLLKAGEQKKWNAAVMEAFKKEVERLRRMNPMAPDYSVQLSYLQTVLDLPWGEFTKDNFDLKRAKQILDEDHFGLEKVKQRILEYLAVLKLKGNMKSPILCLYGPPGVGKTSLGKSIAKALDRKYARIALGGLHDESEIRGHRRTYIGAMPGRIIQNLKKIKSDNPVFVLDEVDKIGRDFRGDPSSALLEVLDPEQNNAFHDNYVEIDYDLSNVLFIATANTLDTIQPALLDRLEIIELTGYTMQEKVQIARKYLIPKQTENHGLTNKDFELSDTILEQIVTHYTRESGVRALEKQIAAIARFVAKEKVMNTKWRKKLTSDDVQRILGVPRGEPEMYQDNETAGVVTGLAWTSVGGEILFVESRLTKGTGKLTLTGQLGDVMKESAVTALTFLKSNAAYLSIDERLFDKWDVHIHVPAGAVPKDGPSAGITMLTSLASVFTQRKVKNKLAMTGEITLRGKVLPIGGVKEKILAAKRAGITDIVMCEQNRKDVTDIEPHYLQGLKIHYVNSMLEVIDLALTQQKVKNPVNLSIAETEKAAGKR